MASQNITVQTNNQLTVNTDLSKIFIYNNRYEGIKLYNAGGAPVTFTAGTVLGRLSANGKVVPFTSAAADGSQSIVGILANDYTVAAGATNDAQMCISGDVAAEKIALQGGDTLDTAVGGRLVRDKIKGETLGVNLVSGTEMTGYDN
jgi:hypothetical protein